VEFILDYNREIVNTIDDSVVHVVENKPIMLRLARGYAPLFLPLEKQIDKNILALGANQKATIAIAFESSLVVSPYIADLNSLMSLQHYKKMIANFKRLYEFEYEVVVCDKHPRYESTKIAPNLAKEVVKVQHHEAHLESVKLEHTLAGDRFVGFIFDGTGYGEDGTLWGGEVFVGKKRAYHFKPLKLLGGEKAVKECKRVALSKFFEHYALGEVLEFGLPFTKKEIKTLYTMYSKNLSCVLSSSVGRLFDMVVSLAGVLHVQSYEGEAGLLSESYVKNKKANPFGYTITKGEIAIDFDFFANDIIERFYATLVAIVVEIAKKEKRDVILSGGVWQNATLLEMVVQQLKNENITYYYNEKIPVNDSGVSVGQIGSILK